MLFLTCFQSPQIPTVTQCGNVKSTKRQEELLKRQQGSYVEPVGHKFALSFCKLVYLYSIYSRYGQQPLYQSAKLLSFHLV